MVAIGRFGLSLLFFAMSMKSENLWRFRPRAVTVVLLLLAVAVPMVLANCSHRSTNSADLSCTLTTLSTSNSDRTRCTAAVIFDPCPTASTVSRLSVEKPC
jgi:hypothetical protein